MKVAISVPDPLFKAADTLARQLKKSRSQLYSEAVSAYLGAHGADAVREQLDSIYAKVDSTPDPALMKLVAQSLDPDETW
jgi:metal-responsive CopG/Arc/MetJ family transcriptional regulator